MAVIAEALGHADERITRKHYAHLSPSYVSQTVRQHAAGLGIVESSNVVPIERAGGRIHLAHAYAAAVERTAVRCSTTCLTRSLTNC
jgi:hypothetical protein